jgi:hypothetical protein
MSFFDAKKKFHWLRARVGAVEDCDAVALWHKSGPEPSVQHGPGNDEGRHQETVRGGCERVSMKEGHQEAKPNEDHNVDVLEQWVPLRAVSRVVVDVSGKEVQDHSVECCEDPSEYFFHECLELPTRNKHREQSTRKGEKKMRISLKVGLNESSRVFLSGCKDATSSMPSRINVQS